MLKISDVCKLNQKSLSAKDKKSKSHFHYLDSQNITENMIDTIKKIESDKLPSRAKRIVQEKDVIVSTVRPNQKHHGILVDLPENLLVSTAFTVLTVDQEKANPYYLYYYLSSYVTQRRMELIASTSTSSYPSLRPGDIGNLKYTKESLAYQNQVGNMIDTIDKKIKLNQNEIDTLKQYSRLLFHKWFINFNFPNEEGKPYRSNGGEIVETDGVKHPKGWAIKPLNTFIEDTSNGDWGEETSFEGAIETYCIRGADMPNIKCGMIGDTPVRYIRSTNGRKKQLDHGNIIIEASGGSPTQSTGRTVLIRDSILKRADKPIYFSNFSKVIIPKDNHSMFLYHVLNHLYDQDVFFRYEGKTSGIKNLLLDNMIKRVKFVSPSLDVLGRFEEKTGVIWDKIFSLGRESELLKDVKYLLIKKYIK